MLNQVLAESLQRSLAHQRAFGFFSQLKSKVCNILAKTTVYNLKHDDAPQAESPKMWGW